MAVETADAPAPTQAWAGLIEHLGRSTAAASASRSSTPASPTTPRSPAAWWRASTSRDAARPRPRRVRPRHARRRHHRRRQPSRLDVRHGARRAPHQPEGAGRRRLAARRATWSRRSIGRSTTARASRSASSTCRSARRRLQSYQDDPLCQAVERAVRAGIVVVASAGNLGQTPDGKTVLGERHLAGHLALRDHGRRASHPGHGRSQRRHAGAVELARPDLCDDLLKPDLVAPGSKIVSLAAANSTLVAAVPRPGERRRAGAATSR